MHDEKKLLKAAMGGDTGAFEQIVKRYQSLICAMTFSGTGRVDISEDLAQETFLSAWKNLCQLKDLSGFRPWLCAIARNMLNNYYRKKKPVSLESATLADLSDQAPTPAENLISKEEHAMLQQTLMQLPEEYRQPLVLFYRQGQSTREVAINLGLNESTVRTRLHRAKQLLREEIATRLERTLKRTAPDKTFTKAVMVAVGTTGIGLTAAGAEAAATAGSAATGTSGTLTAIMSTTAVKIIAAAVAATIVIGVIVTKSQNKPTQLATKTETVNQSEVQHVTSELQLTKTKNDLPAKTVSPIPDADTLTSQSQSKKVDTLPVKALAAEHQKPVSATMNIPFQETVPVIEDANMVIYRGIVKDEQGNPLEGVLVTREWVDTKLELQKDALETRTNSQGAFEFGPVKRLDKTDTPMSPHNLLFHHVDYGIGWWNIYKETELNNPEIILFRPSSVSGFILDANGNTVENALVQTFLQIKHQTGSRTYDYDYYNRDELHKRAVRTDSDGWFMFDRIPYHAKLNISAAHQEYGQYSTEIESEGSEYVVNAGDNDLQLTLSPGGYIKGSLVKDGMPYRKSDILIYIQGREGLEPRGSAFVRKTNKDGQFDTNGLYAGTYYVAALSDHFTKENLTCETLTDVIVNNSGPTEIELHLNSGLTVNVIVFDEDTGEILPDKQISVKSSDGLPLISLASTTNAEGRAVLRLKEGEYSISANGWKEGKYHEFPKEINVTPETEGQVIEIGIQTKSFVYGGLMDKQGDPISGNVILIDESVETDKGGLFEIREPSYSFGTRYLGYAFDKPKKLGRIFFWKPEDANDLEIVLEPLVTIKGRIVDEEGVGINDIRPEIGLLTGPSTAFRTKEKRWDLTINSEGFFQFEGVPIGVKMDVSVEKPGYQGEAELGILEPGQVVDVGDVVLKRSQGFKKDDKIDWTGTLSGRVTDENNQPVVGVKIDTNVGVLPFEDITDWNGRYTLRDLPKGEEISVGGYKKGYGHCYSNVIVDGNDFDLQMFPQGWDLLEQPALGLFIEKWLNTEPRTLEEYRGKVVLLQIGVLLPNYLEKFRQVEKVYKKYSRQGLEVIAIHQQLSVTWAGEVTEKGIEDFIEKYDIQFPFCIDGSREMVRDFTENISGNGAMYSLYDVKATPALYLIDKQGIFRISPTDKNLDNWIKILLAE